MRDENCCAREKADISVRVRLCRDLCCGEEKLNVMGCLRKGQTAVS